MPLGSCNVFEDRTPPEVEKGGAIAMASPKRWVIFNDNGTILLMLMIYATNNHNGNINNSQRVFTNHVTQKDHCHIFFEFASWDDKNPWFQSTNQTGVGKFLWHIEFISHYMY